MKRKCKCRRGGRKSLRKAFRGMMKPVRRAKGPLRRVVNAYHKRVPKLI